MISRAREKSDSDELLLLLNVLLCIVFLTVTIFVGDAMYESLCLLSTKVRFTSMSSKLVVKRLLLFLFCCRILKNELESVDIPTMQLKYQ